MGLFSKLGAGLPTSSKLPTEGLLMQGVMVSWILETFGRECAGSGDPRTALRGRETLAQRLFPVAKKLQAVLHFFCGSGIE